MSKFSRRLDAVHALVLGVLDRDGVNGFSVRSEIAGELRKLLGSPEYVAMREAGARAAPKVDVEVGFDALAHEIWSASQLAPGCEGSEDGVARISEILRRECVLKGVSVHVDDAGFVDACSEIIDYPGDWDLKAYPSAKDAITHMLMRAVGVSGMLSKFDERAREVSMSPKSNEQENQADEEVPFDFGEGIRATLERFESLPFGSQEDYRRLQRFVFPKRNDSGGIESPCCRKCEKEMVEQSVSDGGPGVLSQLAGAQKKKSLEGLLLLPRFMVVCKTCGNKRCPKASDHNNACTGSNEPGQPGSDY